MSKETGEITEKKVSEVIEYCQDCEECQDLTLNQFVEANFDNLICIDCGYLYCEICKDRIEIKVDGPDKEIEILRDLGMFGNVCGWCKYG